MGKSTFTRRGSEKYWNGSEQSCCKTVGGCPDWITTCRSKQSQLSNIFYYVIKAHTEKFVYYSRTFQGLLNNFTTVFKD